MEGGKSNGYNPATERILRTSIPGPIGEVRHVEAGPRGIPHTVTNVEINDGRVKFTGPTLPGLSYQYEADLAPYRDDVNAAIRAALEERMYGPNAVRYADQEAPREVKGI